MPSDPPEGKASTPEERFVEFQYAEMKDLTKQFLTVVTGTLVLTVSLADKILPIGSASGTQKVLLGSCWGLLLVAFILAGAGLAGIFFAAVAAREGAIYGYPVNYKRIFLPSFIAIDLAGVLFAASLVLLAVTVGMRLFK
jgi:hypothetical protein